MSDSYKAYLAFLERLGDQIDELTDVEKAKTAAVRRDDLMAVNECMRQEQAISLTLRSMDHERETMLKDLGMEGVSLSGLPERYPPEIRPEARGAAERLRAKYDIYRSAADVARMTLEINLHEIEKIMEQRGLTGENLPVSRLPGGSFTDIRA